MKRLLVHVLAGCGWCFYGLCGMSHAVKFWMRLLGSELPIIDALLIDVVYYTVSAVMAFVYVHHGWQRFYRVRRALRRGRMLTRRRVLPRRV